MRFIKKFIKRLLFKYNWKLEKIYKPKGLVYEPPSKIYLNELLHSNGILHFGAHRGGEAPIYNWFGKKVIWFEANPEIFLDLQINLKKYNNQKCILSLISDVDDKEFSFNISNNDGASSSIFNFGSLSSGTNTLWPNKKKLLYIKKIKLKSNSIDTLLKNNNIKCENYNHWVIDLQGAELLALQGAKNSIQNCKSIFIEVSNGDVYKNGAQYSEVKNFLKKFNFEPVSELNSKHTNILFKRI